MAMPLSATKYGESTGRLAEPPMFRVSPGFEPRRAEPRLPFRAERMRRECSECATCRERGRRTHARARGTPNMGGFATYSHIEIARRIVCAILNGIPEMPMSRHRNRESVSVRHRTPGLSTTFRALGRVDASSRSVYLQHPIERRVDGSGHVCLPVCYPSLVSRSRR
jgi:hypothetical protein